MTNAVISFLPKGVRHARIVAVLLLLGCGIMEVRAQSVRRPTFSSGGSDRRTSSFTITIGEPIISRVTPSGNGSVTFGFQQSYRSNGPAIIVWADTSHAAPRGEAEIGLYMSILTESGALDIDSLDVTLSFNASLLVPRNVTQGRVLSDEYAPPLRTIAVRVPSIRTSGDNVRVAGIVCGSALGDDTATVINIERVVATTGVAQLSFRDGLYVVDSLCREGGVRLVRVTSPSIRVYPHPIRESATVEVEVTQTTSGSVQLRSLIGSDVRDVYRGPFGNGVTKLGLSVDDIPSGTYVLAVNTEHGVRHQTITVSR